MTPNSIPFPRRRPTGLVLSDDEHRFLVETIANFHGSAIERLLTNATTVPGGGRRLGGTDGDQVGLMEAIGTEAHGFLKLEEETAGRPQSRPRRGGMAERLLKIYDKMEQHLS
jgi:hypothetical protein